MRLWLAGMAGGEGRVAKGVRSAKDTDADRPNALRSEAPKAPNWDAKESMRWGMGKGFTPAYKGVWGASWAPPAGSGRVRFRNRISVLSRRHSMSVVEMLVVSYRPFRRRLLMEQVIQLSQRTRCRVG